MDIGVEDNRNKFKRFLYLGCESGPYKSSGNHLIEQNLNAVIRNLDQSTTISQEEVIGMICDAINEGLSCNRHAATYMLAMCASVGSTSLAQEAYNKINVICSEPQSILEFVEFCEKFTKNLKQTTGWSKVRKRAVQSWYGRKRTFDVAFAITECTSYHKWSHKDLLKLCHIKSNTSLCLEILCTYISKGYNKTNERYYDRVSESDDDDAYMLMEFFKSIHDMKHSTSAEDVANIFLNQKLKWNHLPCSWHGNLQMWKHLLCKLPIGELLPHLPKLHHIKLLETENSWTKIVLQRLMCVNTITTCGLHPYSFFLHRHQYEKGKNSKKKLKWQPDPQIISALNAAFYMSIQNVKPTNKKICVTVDASDSMKGDIINSRCVNCRMVAAAMCFTIARVDPNAKIQGFSKVFEPIDVSKTDTVESLTSKIDKVPLGGTDCARPMITAKKKKEKFDTFIIFTDKETSKGQGRTTPHNALIQYQQKLNMKARLIVVALKSKEYSITKSKDDDGILEICGFNENVPLIINDFIMHRF